GDELSALRYNGPGDSYDSPQDIAIDHFGNVYVTGRSIYTATSEDYVTVKYDTNGNELWVARYDGPGSLNDNPHGMALDPFGNILVTGSSKGVGTDLDYATIKYDSNGNQIWVVRYNSLADNYDIATAIASDQNGNIRVTGYSYSFGTYSDIITINYDQSGNELWVARYDGPVSRHDWGHTLSLDRFGNAFIIGRSQGINIGVNSAYDYVTIMYNSDGDELSALRYNGPGDSYDSPQDIAIDHFGNVYVTGISYGNGTLRDFATIKYSSLNYHVCNEGTQITFTATSIDQGSDDLTFTWDWGDGTSDTVTTYFNDGNNPEPEYDPLSNEIRTPLGIYPFTVTDSVQHTYGDDGEYDITLTIEDDDGGSTTYITNITVNNVAPTIESIEAYLHVNFTLRVAGEKWHSVNITLYEDDAEIWSAGVTRQPGSPDEQAATLSGYSINFGCTYRAVVDYLPNDPRVNGNIWGGNPVWIILEFQDGTSERLHHTFNVRQADWDSDHWNHIDPWEVDLTGIIYRHNITFEATASDPGSDDLIFDWDFGDGGIAGPNIYFNDGLGPDPFPSPEVNPMNVTDTVTHAYSAPGNYTVTLTVTDDDGGIATTTLVLMLQY
ncbi:MAG: SBBP repeat-containing protein, partial [Thermoplasmata archaeon]